MSPTALRKRRTRQHVIEDLSINFVERQVLLCGYAVDRVFHDYGLDLFLFTYDKIGNTENAWIPIQVKATDKLRKSRDNKFVLIRVERADLRAWLAEPFPVILIVYDARVDCAYWLYVQEHFADNRFEVSGGSGQTTVRVPAQQILDSLAVRRFGEFRNAVLERWQERNNVP